jgi:type III secretion protein S
MLACVPLVGCQIQKPHKEPPLMTPSSVLDITREGLLIVLWVSLPVVAVATVTALLIAAIQAVTQLQDQSIGQSIRLVAVMIAVVVTAGWLSTQVLRFAERAFHTVSLVP